MGNRVSKNFNWTEFACKDGCGIKFKVDPRLATMLQGVRTAIDQPLYISSGARCREHNDSCGGARDSWHIPRDGILYAADVQLLDPCARDDLSSIHLYMLADQHGAHGLGLYPRWIHIDSRRIGIMKGQERQRWVSPHFKFPTNLRVPKI
jgi:hypothetical protein